jgi:hypothetical protein
LLLFHLLGIHGLERRKCDQPRSKSEEKREEKKKKERKRKTDSNSEIHSRWNDSDKHTVP